jgi:hypothetical protein
VHRGVGLPTSGKPSCEAPTDYHDTARWCCVPFIYYVSLIVFMGASLACVGLVCLIGYISIISPFFDALKMLVDLIVAICTLWTRLSSDRM